jgi:integrase
MSIVTRKTKAGESRHYARIHAGRGRYLYGPARGDKDEAKRDEARLILEPKRKREQTVDELVEWFLESYATRPRPRTGKPPHEGSVRATKHRLTPFRHAFGHLRPGEIERDALKAWVARYGWAVNSVRTMFTDAIDSELMDRSPLQGITIRQSSGRRHIEVPTAEEVEALADCALLVHGEYGPTFRALILWLAYTTMRPGETFVVEWADIEGDEIVVRRNLPRLGSVKLPKNDQTRRIIFPEQAREAVQAMPRNLHSPRIFSTKLGKRYTEGTLNDYWATVKQRFLAGLSATRIAQLDPPGNQFVPYVLRHFGATHLLELGLSPADVALQLGHTDGGALVMARYGHPSEARARERLRRAMNPAPIRQIKMHGQTAEAANS